MNDAAELKSCVACGHTYRAPDKIICKGSLHIGTGCASCVKCAREMGAAQTSYIATRTRLREFVELMEFQLNEREVAATLGVGEDKTLRRHRAAFQKLKEGG